jgi:chromosome partitioning protein
MYKTISVIVSLERLQIETERRCMMVCKKIAFINSKGGVGKTTSIFNVSGVLSAKGEKTLVIDLDHQLNTTDTMLTDNTEEKTPTTFDFFKGVADLNDVVKKSYIRSRGNAKPKYYGTDVMPSDLRFEYEQMLQGVNIAEPLAMYIEENKYTWALVDMPPSNKSINDICFSQIVDYVVVPFSSDWYSMKGFGHLMDTVNTARQLNPGLKILGIYLSRYHENCSVDKFIRGELKKFGEIFMDVCIPERTDLRECVMYGRPISYFKSISASKSAYEKLVSVMENRIRQIQM